MLYEIPKRHGVKNADWKSIALFFLTLGKKGKLFEIVDMTNFPPNHINCRCSFLPDVK